MEEQFTIELSSDHITNLISFCRSNCIEDSSQWNCQIDRIDDTSSAPSIRPLNFVEKTAHLTYSTAHSAFCAICLTGISKSTIIPVLTCCHTFHKKCLDEWFRLSNNLECPMCRQSNLFDKPINRIFRSGKSP